MKENILLSELEVLLFDCQATGANPGSGHVLEMAWAVMKGKQSVRQVESSIRSFLVRLPENGEVPGVVSRITGIKTGDLEDAPEAEEVWRTLKKALPGSKGKAVPMVIHFYRYEESFLRDLHERFDEGEPFPFEIICTYQLVKHLLPGLGSKSLRAVAGYLGHSVQEFRRSNHHAAATAMIWRHAVRMLARENVFTLADLRQWLEDKKGNKGGKKGDRPEKEEILFPLTKEKRKGLPDSPGVYRYLRSNGDLLYIGKATSLKKRVNSYFHKKKRKKGTGQARQTMEMLTQAADLDITVTGSALEAALLENDEIKRFSPPYNVALRKRDREIAFFSKDLEQVSTVSTEPGESFPLGPLPSPHSLTAFANILAWQEGRLSIDFNDEEFPALFLGLSLEYAPGMQCFREGLDLFGQAHDKFLGKWGPDDIFTGLMVLGKELRRKKLAEMEQAALEAELKAEQAGESEEEEEIEVEEERVWMPEDVERMLRGIIRYGARLIRRSRWFRLLSQSVLSWESGGTSGKKRRMLVIREGDISQRKTLGEGGEIPVPPGHAESFDRRGRYFDVLTYDRLRVLTTELRRLVSDPSDRRVQLKLSPTVTLNREQLLELFKWI